jgi:hypothetical protein
MAESTKKSWLRALISKVIKVDSEEQINRRTLRLIGGSKIVLTAQDSSISDETRVLISVNSLEAACSASKMALPAVGSGVDDGWFVVSSFVPEAAIVGTIEAYGSVTDGATLTLTTRLFCVTDRLALGGTATITSETPVRAVGSASVVLAAGKLYQHQARCKSTAASPIGSKFGILETATVSN